MLDRAHLDHVHGIVCDQLDACRKSALDLTGLALEVAGRIFCQPSDLMIDKRRCEAGVTTNVLTLVIGAPTKDAPTPRVRPIEEIAGSATFARIP